MIPKSPGPDVIEAEPRFWDKIMLHQRLEPHDDSKKSHHAPVPGARAIGFQGFAAANSGFALIAAILRLLTIQAMTVRVLA